MFFAVMPTPEARTRLISHLKALDIQAVFHYLPLHLSEMGRRWGGQPGQCPVTESVSERLVRFPFYTGLSETDQDRVIDAVRSTSF
jgi:dTDP-4-amino-4,6-dideoxygalactose transaminase